VAQEPFHIVAIALGIYFMFVVIRNARKESSFGRLAAAIVAGSVDDPMLIEQSLRPYADRQQFRVKVAHDPDDDLSVGGTNEIGCHFTDKVPNLRVHIEVEFGVGTGETSGVKDCHR
jgi:hypothetical protein